MKKIIITFALATTVFSVSSFAALNSYLQIKSSKGVTQTVTCPEGTCTVSNLAADTYSVTVVDAQSKPVSLDAVKYTCDVSAPRDAASGLATGKRMHKPFHISKEMRTSELVVTQDQSSVSIVCSSSTTVSTLPPAVESSTTVRTTGYDLKTAK